MDWHVACKLTCALQRFEDGMQILEDCKEKVTTEEAEKLDELWSDLKEINEKLTDIINQ